MQSCCLGAPHSFSASVKSWPPSPGQTASSRFCSLVSVLTAGQLQAHRANRIVQSRAEGWMVSWKGMWSKLEGKLACESADVGFSPLLTPGQVIDRMSGMTTSVARHQSWWGCLLKADPRAPCAEPWSPRGLLHYCKAPGKFHAEILCSDPSTGALPNIWKSLILDNL